MTYYILFSLYKVIEICVFYTYSSCQPRLDTFPVLNAHIRLVITAVDSQVLENRIVTIELLSSRL